jgi:hypothetical protein
MDVYIESGTKRVFACSLDWPGWCRSGKDEGQALAALASYGARYAEVAKEAGIRFPSGAEVELTVVERIHGSASTDFGVPAMAAQRDTEALDGGEAKRLVALLKASWTVFDRVVAGAPAELRKGPRGGGRDRDKVVEHVLGAEAAYGAKLGVRPPRAASGAAAVSDFRQAIVDRLSGGSDGTPLVEKGWPVRYAVRRLAWHVLDHAWEIQDRS